MQMSGFSKLEMSGFRHPVGPGGRHGRREDPDNERVKELDRLDLLGQVIERRMTQRQAAAQLGLSLRQVERLCRALRQQGASGLVSRKRVSGVNYFFRSH